MRLHGRVAFITDADSASGRAIASKLVEEGANLVLNSSSNGSAIEGDVEQYQQAGSRVLVTNRNLSKGSEVTSLIDQIKVQFQLVDLVVHNDNVIEKVTVEDCDQDTFQRQMDVNVKTAFLCTQAFGQWMGEQGRGQVVYCSSIHDEKPTGSAFVYSLAKGALKMLTREAALDLGRRGLRVNVIEMGPIEGDDERFHSDISDVYADYHWKVPSNQLGTQEDLANLVAFLASDEAKFINGADIRMDGGFVLHYMDHKMKRA